MADTGIVRTASQPTVTELAEILLEFEGFKRKLSVNPSQSAVCVIEQELGRLGRDVALAPWNTPTSETPVQTTSSKQLYQLQVWSKKFGTFVDVPGPFEAGDGDRFTLVPNHNPALVVDAGTSTPKDMTEKASTICSKVKKLSPAHASALHKMFPSSVSRPKKQSAAFDPTEDCVFLSEQKKKKKSTSRNKPTLINVVVVDRHRRIVPRGLYKTELENAQRFLKVTLQRNMSAAAVQTAIQQASRHLNIRAFIVLECEGGKLVEAATQSPDGDSVIDSATKRKGNTYYITEAACSSSTSSATVSNKGGSHSHQSEESSEVELPVVCFHSQSTIDPAGSTSKNPVTVPDDSENEEQPSSSGHVRPEHPPQNLELLERRRIITEQNQAFAESLRIDQEKAAKVKAECRKQELVSQLRATLQQKFATHSQAEGVRLSFRCENLAKVEHIFCPDEQTKVLYEFVFSTGLAPGNHFTISTVIPRRPIPFGETTLSECSITTSSTLVVEIGDEDIAEALLSAGHIQTEHVETADVIGSVAKACQERSDFLATLNTVPGSTHTVNRQSLYADVLNLFSATEILQEYPLRIRFKEERAIDTGGVCRDMLAGFWEEVYRQCFDGSTLLTPVLHAQTDLSVFPILGRLLSHGYLLEGFIPLRICLPSLAAMLFGPAIEIPDEILVHSFADSLSSVEASLVKGSIAVQTETFGHDVQDKLTCLLSRFGARELPTPQKLKRQSLQVARYEFLTKPMTALTMIHSGIPVQEAPFWKVMGVDGLLKLHESLTATPVKVLEVLEEPEGMNPAQDRVFQYLQQYIGNMSCNEVRTSLRFTTGSSVLCQNLRVIFNSVSGLGRCPFAHTCSRMIELSSDYATYGEFTSEFQSILNDSEYSWSMDAL